MYFSKAIISLLAVAGFAAAQDPNLARREAFELARDEHLVARDEYIEQRDLFLRKEKAQKIGHCSRDPRSKRMICVKGMGDLCGSCPANAAQGARCYCN
ncbi:unnamed protein product [Clonostachys rhizophaga]|uniref:Uncharacterized protein n=1 Tax=Clonostachys rhizophaga TaxID=160324 RepID=A0A9N9YUN9_9HYPO|nr:unnamed protein product [Clonostachys rhizophaga]